MMMKKIGMTFFAGYALFFLFSLISNLPAQEIQIESVLGKVYDLAPKYAVGDKDFYHISTTYLEMNDSGQVSTTRVVDGYFSREVLKFEHNKRYDRFVWRHVTIGERKGKGEVTEFSVLPYAQNFQYYFSEKDITPEHFPVDIDSIPKTKEGYHFFVNLIDAHTFGRDFVLLGGYYRVVKGGENPRCKSFRECCFEHQSGAE